MRSFLFLTLLFAHVSLNASTCATVISFAPNAYAPRRDSLLMSRPFFPDEGGWEFGHNLVGDFFPLRIDGRFERLFVSGFDVMGLRADGTGEVIGRLRPESRVMNGEGAIPGLTHVLEINDAVAVDFEHRDQDGHPTWFAVFAK